MRWRDGARRARLLRDDCAGAMAVEFAITSMVVLAGVVGMVQFDLIFLAQRGIDRGVTQTARWIALNSAGATAASIKTVFVAAATAALGSDQAGACTVSLSAPGTSAGGCVVNVVYSAGAVPGSVATVTAQYGWSPVSSLGGLGALTLISSAALTIQN